MTQQSINPYESPRSQPQAVAKERERTNFVTYFVSLIAVQFLLIALLAPGDGGFWLFWAIVTLTPLDTTFFIWGVFGRNRDFTAFDIAVWMISSIAILIAMTYAIPLLPTSWFS
ncbi:MAG TPA: hypothetical protein VGI40_15725 [Pirellulaceae bacterium]|jgi:hypothetical protein